MERISAPTSSTTGVGRYVMGVKASKSPAEAVNQAYDPIINSWVSAQPMPTLRTNFGITVINDTLFAVGGLRLTYSYDSTGKYFQSVDASATGSNEQYTPLGYGTVIVTPTLARPFFTKR